MGALRRLLSYRTAAAVLDLSGFNTNVDVRMVLCPPVFVNIKVEIVCRFLGPLPIILEAQEDIWNKHRDFIG